MTPERDLFESPFLINILNEITKAAKKDEARFEAIEQKLHDIEEFLLGWDYQDWKKKRQ